MSELSLSQFMTQQSGGGRNKYLGNWKEKGFINIWLHPRASILSLWRHSFARVYINEDKATQVRTREVTFDPVVCYELDEVLEDQFFRVDADGKNARAPFGVRKTPPVLCPICIMQEHLVGLVRDGKLDWRTPLFKFEATDPRKSRMFHVGGFTGLFNGKDMSPEKAAELSGAESLDPVRAAAQRAGTDRWFPATKWGGPIYMKGEGPNVAFKQDARPKHEYAFIVVDNDDLQSGVQIMFGGKGLGGKVIDVIGKAIKEAKTPSDPEGTRGDPQKHPYVIQFTYNGRATNPNEYYDALKMGQVPMTAAVHALLNSPPPDVSKLLARFNLTKMRAMLEEHMLVKLPLDAYFKKAFEAEAKQKAADAAAPPAERVPEVGRNPGSVPSTYSAGQAAFTPPPQHALPPPAAAPEAVFGCDGCGAPMRASETVCAKCSYSYVVADAPAPPPPALPKRSSVGTAPVAPPPPAQAPAEPDPWALSPESVAAPPDANAGYPGDPSDDIPFIANVSCDATEAWNRG